MDNRSRILSRALELFASYGYDAVGVQRVVEAAHVTKPTLYYYFGSKKGLLNALLETYFSELFQVVENAVVYNRDLPLTLNKVTTAYFNFSRQNPVFYHMQLSMWFAPSHSEAFKAVSGFNEKQQNLLENLFIEAARQHGNMKGRHQAYAATFLGMVNTYIGLSLNGYTELNEQLVYKAVHQFMHGIFS
ncbi:MAG: TetR/AcrR family transcriptional regulator [Anaerolineae bacterium]|nr:TetR/AcrR family transcriptional regulator [Anaerolineae bacterium]